uniref:Uncharacterized protein n=1 Tax=Panstrongylus lignarius TaxID=156445 RepID=A0A224XVR5_9HEMI
MTLEVPFLLWLSIFSHFYLIYFLMTSTYCPKSALSISIICCTCCVTTFCGSLEVFMFFLYSITSCLQSPELHTICPKTRIGQRTHNS